MSGSSQEELLGRQNMPRVFSFKNAYDMKTNKNLFNDSHGSYQSDINKETLNNLKSENNLDEGQPLVLRQELFNQKANKNLRILMRSLPPSTLQKNFSQIEKATLKLQDAGVDLPKLALNLRILDRTRMLFRSLQSVLQRETSSAFSRILQVKQKRSRALENVNNRLKARLLMDISSRIQVDKTSQRFFYKWFLKSNPEILRQVTNHILIKQKLTNKIACWRLAYLARVHKQRDKKQDLLWIIQGLMKLSGYINRKQMIYKKEGLDRISPRYHNRAFQIMGDIITNYQKRRIENLKRVIQRMKNIGTRVKFFHNILKQKVFGKLERSFNKLKDLKNRSVEKEAAVKSKLKSRRKDEIVAIWFRKRQETERRDALQRLRNFLKNLKEDEQRKKEAVKQLMAKLKNGACNKICQSLKALDHNKRNFQERERVVRDFKRRVNFNLERTFQKLEISKKEEENEEREMLKGQNASIRLLKSRKNETLWRAFWKLRLFNKLKGKKNLLQKLKKSRCLRLLLINTEEAKRRALNQLRENNLLAQHNEIVAHGNKKRLNTILNQKSNSKLHRAFEKLRNANKDQNQKLQIGNNSLNRLSRMILGKSNFLKYLALKRLTDWRRRKKNQTIASLRLFLKLNQKRKSSLRDALEKLIKLNQQESLKEKMEEMGNAVVEVKNNYNVRNLLRNLIKNQIDKKAIALDRLRRFTRAHIANENQQRAKIQKPLAWLVERLMGKKAIAFYKLLRCFGNGDEGYKKRREDIKVGGDSGLDGWLRPSARKAFIQKVSELLGKRPIDNLVIDGVKKYVERKEMGGDMDGVKNVLSGDHSDSENGYAAGRRNLTGNGTQLKNLKSPSSRKRYLTTGSPGTNLKANQPNKKQKLGVLNLISGLKQKAESGDPQAEHILNKINNRSNLRLNDHSLFMKDRDETARYSKLIEFMDQTPDLTTYEFAGIIKKNRKKRENLWPIMEEVDEASDKERLLRYLERNNSNGQFDDIIREGRAAGTRFSDLLAKLDSGNRGGAFEKALDFVNNDGVRLRDKLVGFLMEMDGKTGGVFRPLLAQVNQNPELGIAQIYERGQEALNTAKDSSDQNPRFIAKVSEKMRDLINENDSERIRKILDFITHCNRVQKGKFNDLVKYANNAQDEEKWGEEELFNWFSQNWQVPVDKIYSEVDLGGEGDVDLKVKRRDVVRAVEDGDRKKRWEIYLKERPSWDCGQDILAELNRQKNWKLTDLFQKILKKERELQERNQKDNELETMTNMLNWNGRKIELEDYLIQSNEGQRNREILDFIYSISPEDLKYLDILQKVFDTNQRNANQHILDFINRETSVNIPQQILKNLRVRGKVMLAREVENSIGTRESHRPVIYNKLRKILDNKQKLLDQAERMDTGRNDQISNPESLEGEISELEGVLDDLEERKNKHSLMDQIENYMRLNKQKIDYQPLKDLLKQKVRQREEKLRALGKDQEEQIPELEDLIEVMNQDPEVRESYPQIDRLLAEKNKNPKFQLMFDYLKKNNTNGKFFPLIKELDYKRLLESREREIKKNQSRRGRGKNVIPEVRQPNLMQMALLLKSKAKKEPKRFQAALDHFDEIEKRNTAQKLGNYMIWAHSKNQQQNQKQNPDDSQNQDLQEPAEEKADFSDLINKLNAKEGMNLTDALEEIKEADPEGNLESVWNRLNEQTLTNETLLEFMKKTPEDAEKYKNVISYIETHPSNNEAQEELSGPGLIELLDVIQTENQDEPGKMEKLLSYIDNGGLDIDSLNLDSSDPIFKYFETKRALGQNPELFEKLQSGILQDPEELLRHLKRNNEGTPDPEMRELISQLESYCNRHRQYPDYGSHNQKHVLFKIFANMIRPFYRKLVGYGRKRINAEKIFKTLVRKNTEIKQLRALNDLKIAKADQELEQDQIQNLENKKQANLKRLLNEMYNENLRIVLLRLRGHKTSDKYRKWVSKGLKEKFWGIMIRCMNPGIYKAYHRLKKFKNMMVIEEMNRTRKMRKFVGKLKEGSAKKRANALFALKLNKERMNALEKIRKRIASSLQYKWNQRLREALWNLTENKSEVERDEDEMEDTVKMVFARAGHRAQLQQLKVYKDLQIKGVQKQMINENILNRMFGNAARNEEDLRREALKQLQEYCREGQDYERKMNRWLQLSRFFGKFDKLRALNALREFLKKLNIKMSMNSLFKWKTANMKAKNQRMREMESLVSLYKGALIGRLEKNRLSLMRDALYRLRYFLTRNKTQVGHMMRKLIHANTMKKTKAFHTLKDLNSAISFESDTANKIMSRLLRCLVERRLTALKRLRAHAAVLKLRNRLGTTILTQYTERCNVKNLSQVKSKLDDNARLIRERRAKLNAILKMMSLKRKREQFMKWRDLLRQEHICRFNSKITSLCLCLRKNHRAEARSALERWSQKKQKLKYEKLAAFLESAKGLQQRETYTHMKIHHMQKKFSSMCKVWGRLLDFVETRKRENIMYAFDAMSLDNPWADRVPKLLACGQVMSAQMCFWKLRLTRKQLLKKRRQRATNYKIDKVKLVFLESIFSKKMSQYFMNIQMARRNKYL